MITHDDVSRYTTDGVVCLRGIFNAHWLSLARQGIERNKATPGPFFRDQTSEQSPGHYVFDYWTWPQIPEFEKIIFESPAGTCAGNLLGARQIRLLMDNWFMREAGSSNAAPWHHDLPYFDFVGTMCNVWIPLERSSPEQGLEFVRGSHAWARTFAPQHFRDHVPFDGVTEEYEPLPDFTDDAGAYEFLRFDLAVGDCLVFDLRTVHRAAGGNVPLAQTVHRLSLRFAAENTRFVPRGSWTQEITDHLRELGQRDHEQLDCALLPVVWEACA